MRLVAAFVLLIGADLVFAGSTDAGEVASAVGFAALAALLAWAIPRAGETRFGARAPWARVIALPLLHAVTDTAKVAAVLLRAIFGAVRGELVTQDFADPCAPEGALRRALVTLGISFAPNSYVVHVPPEGRSLVLHALARHKASPNADWPL